MQVKGMVAIVLTVVKVDEDRLTSEASERYRLVDDQVENLNVIVRENILRVKGERRVHDCCLGSLKDSCIAICLWSPTASIKEGAPRALRRNFERDKDRLRTGWCGRCDRDHWYK